MYDKSAKNCNNDFWDCDFKGIWFFSFLTRQCIGNTTKTSKCNYRNQLLDDINNLTCNIG